MNTNNFANVFGAYANLITILIVTIYGIYWLTKPNSYYLGNEYRKIAYRYWWYSWLVWSIAWSLIAVEHTYYPDISRPELEIPILIFDNLNSVFLIIVYVVITRGDELKALEVRKLAIKVTLSLATIYAFLYPTFYLYGDGDIKFAYEIHRTCSMCIAVFTFMLVGWAFKLRFNTLVVLIVGCIYGFAQPIIYETQLPIYSVDPATLVNKCKPLIEHLQENAGLLKDTALLDNCRPILENLEKNNDELRNFIAFILCLLKIVWAIVCTKALSRYSSSSESLIKEHRGKTNPFLSKWHPSVAVHATILVGLAIILSVSIIALKVKIGGNILERFGAAFSIIGGVTLVWKIIWSFWKSTKK